MDSSRWIVLIALVGISFGVLYLGGGFLYAFLDQFYGPDEDVQIARCGFLEDKLASLRASFERMERTCIALDE